ncbi:MAG: HD domain-containing protein [Planctomycetes bacterium]|nr:HD domain-containing protein [Planctomycetota bacterium]MCB9872513.1 HD domain-containing protein [Planctomycetota bacterium]MCB9888366.1 HD domain-containing protein [Planctomycetota bacterium]
MTDTPRARIDRFAPWLLDPELGVCVVGSSALQIACERAGIPGPVTADLDLAWAPDLDRGAEILRAHDVFRPTTEANQRRGTLALDLGGARVEITSFRRTGREPVKDMEERIAADLAGRDMTLGALAHWLEHDRILDPFGGLEDWREKRIVAVGDPAERILEHPVRWLRYYRRAHQWGFSLDSAIRKVDLERSVVRAVPVEAIGSELRAALLSCASPGRYLLELAECGLLQVIAPELGRQFDGRPAGPVRHHPEVSQALHLILALEWIVIRTAELDERDRAMAIVAVLCHDLGKSDTPPTEFPSHLGHEQSGLEAVRSFLSRYPVLADPAGRRLAELVCSEHLRARELRSMRPGTLARLYEDHFRDRDLRVDLFALALGADAGGRLDRAAEGERIASQVETDIRWLQECCSRVDVAALRRRFPDDLEKFRGELHQARARALGDD